MALTKSAAAQVLLASQSNAAGSTKFSDPVAVGYGCSIPCLVTNGGTGPSAGCIVSLQVSADGVTWYDTDLAYTAPTTASAVTPFTFRLGIGGAGDGDWAYARVKFGGNAGQAVTVQAYASSTTSP